MRMHECMNVCVHVRAHGHACVNVCVCKNLHERIRVSVCGSCAIVACDNSVSHFVESVRIGSGRRFENRHDQRVPLHSSKPCALEQDRLLATLSYDDLCVHEVARGDECMAPIILIIVHKVIL